VSKRGEHYHHASVSDQRAIRDAVDVVGCQQRDLHARSKFEIPSGSGAGGVVEPSVAPSQCSLFTGLCMQGSQ